MTNSRAQSTLPGRPISGKLASSSTARLIMSTVFQLRLLAGRELEWTTVSAISGCFAHQRLMFDYFASVVLANAFFDQCAVVFVKRKILGYCFIDNKASVTLLDIGN